MMQSDAPYGKPRKRRVLFYLILLLIPVVVVTAGMEIYLRLNQDKHIPNWRKKIVHENEPKLFEDHPVYGWKPIPGNRTIPSYSGDDTELSLTIYEDGRRFSGKLNPDVDYRVILIGGSFIQGFALSDEQTMAYKLNQAFPDVNVLNYGVGGYGTYQSLLVLRDLLSQPSEKKTLVVYGFADPHATRNTATVGWRQILDWASPRGHVYIPYCRLSEDGNSFVEYPPQKAYPNLPLRDHSAFIYFLENVYIHARHRDAALETFPVTTLLIQEMQDICTQAGVGFMTAVLNLREENFAIFDAFVQKSGMTFLNCNVQLTDELKIPGEGHPNEKANDVFARCISHGIIAWLQSVYEPKREKP